MNGCGTWRPTNRCASPTSQPVAWHNFLQCRSRPVRAALLFHTMRQFIRCAPALLFLVAFTLPGCTPSPVSEKSRAEAERSAAKARSEEEVAREAAKKALQDRANEIQRRIEVLKEETKPARA